MRNLANRNVGASDFVRPGHIFPLVAREGGVLMRSGHTEAAVDLCKLAGLPPIGVICELVNDDGTVKRGPQVAAFAAEHGLKQVSVADLIAYRQRKETLIERVACSDIETPGGKAQAFTYTLPWDVDAASRRGLRRHPRRRGRAGPAAFRGCGHATSSAPATGSTRSCA